MADRGVESVPEVESLLAGPGRELSARRGRLRVVAVLGVAALGAAAVLWRQPAALQRGAATSVVEEEGLPAHKCSAGKFCALAGCCTGGKVCVAQKLSQAIPHAFCKASAGPGEFTYTSKYPKVNGRGDKTWQQDGRTCHSRFVAPPVDVSPIKHNGVTLPDVCIKGSGEHHVFVISDWGGIEKDFTIEPADVTKTGGAYREWEAGFDDEAGTGVAEAMQERAAKTKPDYVINAGSSFYGGINAHCGPPPFIRADTGQFKKIYEDVYKGEGLDGKQWLGVLGYQDYGGSRFIAGWDQIIGYTWGGPGSTGRWMVPAQYYRAIVRYEGFEVEYYFIDSSIFNANEMCNPGNNKPLPHCRVAGPKSVKACKKYFKEHLAEQLKWLDSLLKKSTADWQIVVTNTPPWKGTWQWSHLARTHGIDLFISGNKHMEELHNIHDKFEIIRDGWGELYMDFMASTPWIVSGGGGGASSVKSPQAMGPVQYGFMDLTFNNSAIKVEIIDRDGGVRQSTVVRKRLAAVPYPFYKGQLTPEEEARDKPMANGCPRKQEFYVYRVQDDKDYADENINAASLAGALWYIHHEVVIVCPRKFGMTRIRRLKVTMQNPCDLYRETHSNFGPFQAYDSARCHVDNCKVTQDRWGYFVGCQHIPFNKGIFAAYCDHPHVACRYPHWYSFPGKCPNNDFNHKNDAVCQQEPGGFCKNVTGARDCTYNIERAGEISFDELYTSTSGGDWASFCATKKEYNNVTDKGEGVSFWDGIYSPHKCIERYDKVLAAFKAKYPHMPMELETPHCDFFKSDPIGNFLYNTGSGYSRSAKRTGYAR